MEFLTFPSPNIIGMFNRLISRLKVTKLPCLILAFVGAVAYSQDAQVVDVIDGDTLTIEVFGVQQTVDIFGVDAPELDQPYGEQARRQLLTGTEAMNFDIVFSNINSEFELIRFQLISGSGWVSLAEYLVINGAAWATGERGARDLMTVQQQAAARSRGLWGLGDAPIPPWEWRSAD